MAVVHGGPGASGEMAPAARELSATRSVLEPIQTRDTLKGQLEELVTILKDLGSLPVVLIGYSWGAVLSFILAAHYPSLVKKLILVSSGVFEEKYAASIMETRLSRLSEQERATVDRLLKELDDPAGSDTNRAFARLDPRVDGADPHDPLVDIKHAAESDLDVSKKNRAFAQLGEIMARADSYDPLLDIKDKVADSYGPSTDIRDDITVSYNASPHAEDNIIEFQYHIYQSVWKDAQKMRSSGDLVSLGGKITCPVIALHGDYDPHPPEGVRLPLSRVLSDFRFILLDRCGHCPWHETHAREKFYAILREELQV